MILRPCGDFPLFCLLSGYLASGGEGAGGVTYELTRPFDQCTPSQRRCVANVQMTRASKIEYPPAHPPPLALGTEGYRLPGVEIWVFKSWMGLKPSAEGCVNHGVFDDLE